MSIQDQLVTIDMAVDHILQGSLVIYPTETFFALGCNAFDKKAVARIFTAKGRSVSQPLPIIVSSMEQALSIAKDIDSISLSLMEKFWPGPLTLIVPAKEELPTTAGTIALRVTSNKVAHELVKKSGFPLISSSANRSGYSPVTLAQNLDKELLPHVAGIVDQGEQPKGGKPSTIVYSYKGKLLVQREGAIAKEALREAGFLYAED